MKKILMRRKNTFINHFIQFFLFIILALNVQSQSGFVSTGASNLIPQKGAISYSIGEVGYVNSKSQSGSIDIGIQQSFQFSPVTALQNIELYNDILIYPNPSHGTLFIKNLPQQLIGNKYSYKIVSSEGKEIKSDLIQNTTTIVEVFFLNKGLYHLIIYAGNRLVKNYKFLKL